MSKDDICKIIDIDLNDLYKRIEAAGYHLKLTDEAKAFVAEQGYDPQYGARPLKRAIQRFIEDPLAESIVTGKIKLNSTLIIEIDNENGDSTPTPEKLKVTVVE